MILSLPISKQINNNTRVVPVPVFECSSMSTDLHYRILLVMFQLLRQSSVEYRLTCILICKFKHREGAEDQQWKVKEK